MAATYAELTVCVTTNSSLQYCGCTMYMYTMSCSSQTIKWLHVYRSLELKGNFHG